MTRLLRPTKVVAHMNIRTAKPVIITSSLLSLFAILTFAQNAPTQNGPAVTLSSKSITFRNAQVLFTTSAPQTVTLTNSGTAPLTMSGMVASGDFSATNDCGATVAPKARCTISVTFTPTVAGERTGAGTITDNAADSPQSISLSGTGLAPVTVSPTGLTFGNQTVGSTSAPQAITVTNNQTTSLTISSIVVTGDFSQSNTCGSSLAAGAKCTVNASFTPTAMGTRSGAITIVHSAASSPTSVQLTGTGIVNLTLSASTLSFGSVTVGGASAAQTVSLSNSSSIAIAITSAAITGSNVSDFSQTNTCG